MKKIFLSLMLLAGTLTSIVSCSDEKLDPTATSSAINLSSPTGGSFVLTGSTAGTNAFTAKWTPADFGFSSSVTYSLQAVKSTESFSNTSSSIVLGTMSSNEGINEKSVTQRVLNNLLLSAGGSIGTSGSFKLRVIGKPSTQLASSTNGVAAISNEVSISATPYDTFDEFQKLYLPGSYGGASTFADWSGAGNSATIYSSGNDGKYEGFVWMNVANPEFKFNSDPTWSGNDKGESSADGSFTGNLGGSNIKPAEGAGTYFFTVNWPAQTYTMGKRQVAIIGAATPNGWGNPTYMTFDTNPASPYFRMYTIDLALTNDEFLIRLKDDWSVKMGTTSGNTENTTTGGQYKIKLNGGNMKVPAAGNYKVVLDIRNSANYNIRLMPN
ncbi:SusE domain-containing protein [Flavobacterium sp.]|uniref:SusE domain-containing protein n=1 Tax=Flavobacterium sp. TaxID=239 RepID=UPI0026084EEA|nr:SusE domain-containing protein [Flavobacterium sp.]